MATYILLLRATEAGASRMLLSGAGGAEAQHSAIQQLGGSDIRQFVVTGDYDVVISCSLPDEVSVLALSMAMEAGGFYTNALRAFSPKELEAARAMFPELIEARGAEAEEEGAQR